MIVVAGSIMRDLFVYTTRLPAPGETVTGSEVRHTFGGKGSNVAVQAALLGSQVMFIGRIGEIDDFGVLENLVKYGIDTSAVRHTPGAETGTAIITVDEMGENTIVVVPGANSKLAIEDVGVAPRSARVVVSNLEIPMQVAAHALSLAGGLAVLNPSPFPPSGLSAQLIAATDLLVVNRTELALLLGVSADACSDVPSVLPAALQLGFQQVVVTLGSDGIYVAPPCLFIESAVAPRGVLDTTGAGDSFLGALVHRLVAGDSLEAATRFAARVSAYSVGAKGCQPSYGDKTQFL